MAKKFDLFVPIFILVLGWYLRKAISAVTPSYDLTRVTILVGFIFYNILGAYSFDLMPRLRSAWAVNKIWHLVPGFFIGSIPIGIAYMRAYSRAYLSPFQGISTSAALLLFTAAAGEELWFRGIALELGGTRYSKIKASLIFGLIFALVHPMPPVSDLPANGFALVLAGYSGCLCYFIFGSIWAPLGLHFANNLIQQVFGSSTRPNVIAYIGPQLLISILLTFILQKKRGPEQ